MVGWQGGALTPEFMKEALSAPISSWPPEALILGQGFKREIL